MKFSLNQETLLFHVVLSAAFVLAGIVAIKIINRFFQGRQRADKENRGSYRAWTVANRNLVAAVVFLLLLGVWVDEFKSVALSLTAFAAALLLVGKELVMCFMGAFMRMISRPFQLGDLIEIGSHCGEVIDMDVLTTTLAEVAPARQYNGATVQVPNSMMLTTAVRNHSRSGKYMMDIVRIPLVEGADPAEVESRLLAIVRQVCEPFLEEAGRSLRHHGDMRFVDLWQFEPRVLFEPAAAGRLDVIVCFPAPVSLRLPVAQYIIRQFHQPRTQDPV